VTARLGDGPEVVATESQIAEDRLSGSFGGDLRTTDASRHAHVLEINLTLRGRSLSGAITARSDRSGLSHWIELAAEDPR
jgi:hypothetical protein